MDRERIPMTDNVIEITTEEEFIIQVLDYSSTIPVLVDFWAPWCSPCVTFSPILVNVARTFGGDRLRLAKVNVEALPGLQALFGIRAIPSLRIIGNGKEEAGMIGVHSSKEVADWLNGFFDYWRPNNGEVTP